MKAKYLLRTTLLVSTIIFLSSVGWGQTSVFKETMDVNETETGTKAISAVNFDNPELDFSGTGDSRTTNSSSGYDGASGNRNIFLTNAGDPTFIISNINTSSFSELKLEFGLRKSTVASDATHLRIEVSEDGENFNLLGFPAQPTGSGTTNWRLIEVTEGTIPSTESLTIKFTNIAGEAQINIDDIHLYGTTDDPYLNVNPVSIPVMTYVVGNGPSQPKSFEITGANLNGTDVTITAPTNFEVSESEVGVYGSSLTLTDYNGSAISIWVRLAEGLPVGEYHGDVEVYGGGVAEVDAKTVSLSGRVVEGFDIPYANSFRTQHDVDLAIDQGFQIANATIQEISEPYLQIDINGFIESPSIDFTPYDILQFEFSTATWGTGSGRELSLFVSSNDGIDYDVVETFPVTASDPDYEIHSFALDVTGVYNVTSGKFKLQMTSGTGRTRFRDFSITEPESATISPATAHFNLYDPKDISTTIIWNVATAVAGVTFDGSPLSLGSDYTVQDNTLTIMSSVFEGAVEGNTFNFIIAFDEGDEATFTIEVVYLIPSFQVTFSKLGEGDITAKVDDVEITSGSSVDIGSEIVFTATPADGYQVKQWTLNSQVVADNTSNALVVPSIDADVTVTVEFEPIEPDTYKVTYSVVGSDGTLTATADDNPISSGDDIVAGSTIVFTASPEVGYTIKGWTVNGDLLTEFSDDIYTIPNLAADVVVTVEFEPIVPETYTVTFSVVGSNGSLAATANGEGITSGASVEEGSLVVFTASPSAEHRVKEWTINGEVIPDNTSNELSIVSLDGDVSVTVSFEEVIPQIYTVTFSVVEVDGETNGTLTATANASNISSGDSVEEGSAVEFVATPNEGFLVKVWVVNGDPLSEFTDNTYTINGLSDDVVVTVEFVEEEEEKYSVTFTVKAGLGNLVVSADGLDIVSGQEVAVGSTVVFSADPAPHYRVKEWVHNNEVVVGNTSNEFTIPSLDENATVTVEFEEVIPEMYTVSFSVVEVDGHTNGTLAATVNTLSIASGVQVEEGSTIVFTASPSDGYRLKEWSVNDDPLADYTDNTYTLTGLGANTTVTVQFEVITSVPSLALGGVRVYPNPFTSTISIANAESVSRVIITDIIGKQVMAVKLNGDTHINTSSLRSGVYLVILEDSNGQRVVRRMMKR
ncbi:MAG: X2-like carbohydrate binding domain-containing protein [Bacteroidales bacterium]|nr:X2-like carbohydrate binding domain-containing protein [Bacteroidales bacterium]